MTKITIAEIAIAIACVGCGPSVPACDAPEVAAVAVEAARKLTPAVELSGYGELTTETTRERRMCVVELALDGERILRRFALTPMDGGRFYLQFTGQ